MRRNLSKNKMLNISVIALFLAVSFAGCLENNEDNTISPNDIVVNPVTLVGGEFQPLVLSAKRDISVFIPHMVIDPASNYVQNGTVLDMKIGETKQLTILAPPRIDVAFIFLSYYGTEIWSIRNPSESWNNWVERGGMNPNAKAVVATGLAGLAVAAGAILYFKGDKLYQSFAGKEDQKIASVEGNNLKTLIQSLNTYTSELFFEEFNYIGKKNMTHFNR